MSDVLTDPWFESIRAAIAGRYRAGEPIDDLTYDYEAYGVTKSDVIAITKGTQA